MRITARRRVALAAAALVATGMVTAVAPTASAAAPTIDWRPCNGSDFCAKVRVPLDYDDPNGPKISLAVVKQPASDPSRRIGSLFVNPGGPGGSGVQFVLQGGHQLFTPQVRARFDLVGFDPRGIGESTPLLCFPNIGAAERVLTNIPYPNTAAERSAWFASDRKVQKACATRGNPILDHMSTADAARDMDQLRAAVGDDQITYYGVSYGSYLGNTYANLFPDRVRALVIDGVLDPIAWTTGRAGEQDLPFSTRLHSAAGAQKTLDEFFRLCDAGGSKCALAPNSSAKFAALYRSLAAHPLHLGNGSPYDETFLMSDTLGAMYDSAEWPDFAQYLADLRTQASTAVLARDRATDATYDNFVEGFPGVACSDSVNPQQPSAWIRAAGEARRTDGYFGPVWTWASSLCAHWPAQSSDRYLGPFNHQTANPVLVVGNLSDPATPYQGAQVAARLLPNSRLLTVHGWGHTSLFLSRCADQNIANYLLTSQVPPVGTVCDQDDVPFQGSSSANAKARPLLAIGRPRW